MRTGFALASAAIALAACSNFEDPALVVDLRPLAVVASPAEVVVDVDLEAENFTEAVDLDDLVDVEFCALIADPAIDRGMSYRFSACDRSRSFRCDEPDNEGDLVIDFGEGSVGDPETSPSFDPMCATLTVTPALQGLLMQMIEDDPRRILEGADVQIELRVETDGPSPEVAYIRKSARYSGRLPLDRTANLNPSLDGFTVTRDDGSEELLPLGRCADIEPLLLSPGEHVRVDPIVPEGTAEDYVQLDLELNPVFSSEGIRYTWLTTTGGWQRISTGGPKDAFGNVPLARNDFDAEEPGDDIEVWIIQRDERLGQAWFRSCVRVQ